VTIEFEAHPFWDFSLSVYGADGVAPACIALQERCGVDVNVLLFCIWIGVSGRGTLSSTDLADAVEAVAAWNRDVVCGLRAVRRWMKDARTGVARGLSEALRRQIVEIEVACEHAEQLALGHAVTRAAPPSMPGVDRLAGDAIANSALYFRRLGAALAAPDRDDLATILAAALPAVGRPDFIERIGRSVGGASG
jgi:uncharacterized protein (TIGR02444 family)